MFKKCKCTQGSDEPDNETVLVEEYKCYARVAESYAARFNHPEDKRIAEKYLDLLSRFMEKRSGEEIPRNVVEFFQFFIKALNWVERNQPVALYSEWFPRLPCHKEPPEITWLEPEKCYVFDRRFPDGSCLRFGAILSNPAAGWHEGGLMAWMNEEKAKQELRDNLKTNAEDEEEKGQNCCAPIGKDKDKTDQKECLVEVNELDGNELSPSVSTSVSPKKNSFLTTNNSKSSVNASDSKTKSKRKSGGGTVRDCSRTEWLYDSTSSSSNRFCFLTESLSEPDLPSAVNLLATRQSNEQNGAELDRSKGSVSTLIETIDLS